jgi:SRSO17 transposase
VSQDRKGHPPVRLGDPLSRLIAIAVTRWRIEEDHQLAKQSTGLDAGQVIRWKSWHRWTAICLLACIYLAVAIQRQQGVVRPDRTRQSDVP